MTVDRKPVRLGRLKKRKDFIEALARATEEDQSQNALLGEETSERHECYTMSREEMQALIGGDLGKIENWVGRMDRSHATWLLYRLIQEKC